jgi:Tol biopolymer transport system component
MWSPQGRSLAFLEDPRTLSVLDVGTWTTRQVLLPEPGTRVFWRPQGNGLTVQATDGSLWWIPDMAVDHAEQLTPPLPMIRDVRWSPDGERLAFVSATDLYVVDVH